MKLGFLTILTAALAFVAVPQPSQRNALRLVQTIPLPNVEGRIDHMAVDVPGERLFVAALGNNTLEVLDLRVNKWLTRITGLKEPQGIFFVPRENKLFVANADDGSLKVFDGTSYKLLSTEHFSSDADNVRYDAARNQIYVGYGEGALGILDAATGGKLAEIPLGGHPESFRLEESGTRIFVNVPGANHSIAVLDRVKRSTIATWTLAAQSNFPMALDEANHRLMVVTRRPARLIVLDSQSGKLVASQPAVSDADDVFYDAAHQRVYISGGGGFIDVFNQRDPDHYALIAKITTAPGARTSFFVPELHRLYLAVPHRGNQTAEIRVYEVQP
ncbi:MAG TPA: YncE family protein [Terriglobia bacterium]|nr:YncE family protein [Terriglobia bacterium]